MSKYVDINIDSKGGATKAAPLRIPIILTVASTLAWFIAIIITAGNGTLSALYQPLIPLIIAATIIIPTLGFKLLGRFRALVETIGHRRIVMFHIWRIPAAFVFFWYGFNGMLPPVFWILAGVGDLLTGIYALRMSLTAQSPGAYAKFHRVGFADFVVAVGTGLTFTLLLDPRMAPVTTLPLALIPLFGVGISGASHLMAFDMLKRGAGFESEPTQVEAGRQNGRWSRLGGALAEVARTLESDPHEDLSYRVTALNKRVDALEMAAADTRES
jgi:hypothetical protein